jgi:hypothetical protein
MRTKGAKNKKHESFAELLNELDFMQIGFAEKKRVKEMFKLALLIGKMEEIKEQRAFERSSRVEAALRRVMTSENIPKN